MEAWTEHSAGDIMSSPLITVSKDTPIREVAMTLSENDIGGALVLDYEEKPIGVISLHDIAAYVSNLERPAAGFYRYAYPKVREGEEGPIFDMDSGTDEAEIHLTPVGEIMTPEIIAVDEDERLPKIVETMWQKHIHRIFVSRRGTPVGVISTMDVFRVLSGGPVRA